MTLSAQATDPVLLNDWHVLARSQDLQPGTVKSARLLGCDLVLWRGQDTKVLAWEDRCPHRSVRLSRGQVAANTLVCAYHGLAYNAEGQCIKVPAHPDYTPPKQACIRSYQVRERYGLVYVCLGQPTQEPVLFPEWDDPSYRCYMTGPYVIRSPGFRAIENFLDVAHFPFVHAGILGDAEKPEIPDYQVSIDEIGVCARNIQVWQPDPYGTGQGAYVSYDYWAFRPLTAYLRKLNPGGECLTLLYNVTPVSEEECIAWASGAINYSTDLSEEAFSEFQNQITLQDLDNLESHHPKRFPLNLQAEFHLPCDRTSLAYRKWLKQLGVTYGVIQ